VLVLGTRGRNFAGFYKIPLPRVPLPRHSGKPPFFSSPCKQQSITKKRCALKSNIHSLETSHNSRLHIFLTHPYIVVLRPTQSFLETQQQKASFASNSRLYIRLSCTCVPNHFRTSVLFRSSLMAALLYMQIISTSVQWLAGCFFSTSCFLRMACKLRFKK
jgi:hypothetical protein